MKTIEQNILKFIDDNKLIEPEDKVLIGLSGGPDSIFLINFLHKYLSRFKISIVAAHINHSLRKEADEEENFCKNYCDNKNIKFYSIKTDIKELTKKEKISVEEIARKVRYNFFEEIKIKEKCTKIATAHNMGDNAETVFLNLIKGSGLSGLRGIPIKRGYIIRPLLSTAKERIICYLNNFKIEYCTDSSNKENIYERNFLRNEIFPKIKEEINPLVEEALLKNSLIVNDALKLVNEIIEQKINSVVKPSKNELRIKIIPEEEKFVINGIIKNVVEKYLSIKLNYTDLDSIYKLYKLDTGKFIILKEKLKIIKDREHLVFSLNQDKKNNKIKILLNKEYSFEEKKIFLEKLNANLKEIEFSNKYEIISGNNIEDFFILRKWKIGDKFIPLGMKNFKLISDFLTDEKISADKKKDIYVLQNGKNIVCVVGLRIDERYKLIESTNKIVKIWVK